MDWDGIGPNFQVICHVHPQSPVLKCRKTYILSTVDVLDVCVFVKKKRSLTDKVTDPFTL